MGCMHEPRGRRTPGASNADLPRATSAWRPAACVKPLARAALAALALTQVASACAARRAVGNQPVHAESAGGTHAACRVPLGRPGPTVGAASRRGGGQRGPIDHSVLLQLAGMPSALSRHRRATALVREPRGVISLLSAQGLTLDSDDNDDGHGSDHDNEHNQNHSPLLRNNTRVRRG